MAVPRFNTFDRQAAEAAVARYDQAARAYDVARLELYRAEQALHRAMRTGRGARSDGHTPRQLQVLMLVMRGFGNQRIANQLGIAKRTVVFHVSSLLAKQGVRSRQDLIAIP